MQFKYYLLSLLGILFFSSNTFSQLVINEGSNRNYSTIADEDGEFPDWIELYNSGTDTIHLFNYSLTDDILVPQKWVFPAITIAPQTFKPVFCSGKNRKPISGFTTVLSAANYNPTTGWNTHNFTSPFYWDGVSSILINTCSYSTGYTLNSIFNQSATSFASCSFAFQDGNDAACSTMYGNSANQRPNLQLNGQTIGTGTLQNSPTDYPAPYGNWYWGARHQLLILPSELAAAGLVAGYINSLAFDIASTDPAMIYELFEVNMKLVSYSTLSTTFETVNVNNYQHTNFSIAQSGETIYLFNSAQSEISNLYVNCQNLDISRGSFLDASPGIFLFDTPTPGATNNSSTTFSSYLLPPVLSSQSGIYGTTVNLTITHPNGLASQVFYTLDGSDPTMSSILYSGNSIPVYFSTVIKARVFAPGFLPSPIATASYLFGVNHQTPIISLTTENSNLYGPDGIFDNWWEDWQRAAYIDYFSENNQLLFSQNTGMQVDGGWGGSRSQPQHSFRLELANSVLGENAINSLIIPNRPNRTKYSTFYLRNGSNQYLQFPYKDAIQEEAMSGTTNNYYSAWRPVSVYINGGYFGLYELREKIDPEYFKELDNADLDSLDILSLSVWNNSVLRSVYGSPVDTFYSIYNAFNSLNSASSNYWDEADQYFDMTYYTDYIIAESWMGNVDWPQNNIKIMRSNKTNFRYRFCTIDMELAMAPNSWSTCYDDHISYLLSQNTSNPFINIWLKGIQNNRFRDYFINRFADLMNTEYLMDRLLPLEDNFFNATVIEMQKEYARWGDPSNIQQQMTTFYDNHLMFQSQLTERSNQVRNHIESNFNLPNQVDLTLDVHPAGAGKIHISTIEPTVYPWQGIYFNGLPVKIEAIPNPGYAFSNWGQNGLFTNVLDSIYFDTLTISSIQFDAYFVETGVGINELNVTNSDFLLYPNPANGSVVLVNKAAEMNLDLRYEICDLTGRRLINSKLNGSSSETIINLQGLPEAVYLIRIIDGKTVKEQLRLVKIGN
jgi:hypothetical protein